MEPERLAERFEAHRAHLRAVAYRMLGSLSDADDAVQESWLRLSRADTAGVENLGGWLTTVVGRVCLDMLRSRAARREEPLDVHVPDPVVGRIDGAGPEDEALLTDSVGLALLVVLDALAPAERFAFVMHDTFAVPFDEIGAILGRSPNAAAQVASRARRRVHDAATPDADLGRQRAAVAAFLAAARDGDFDGLLAVLDPDVVLRADAGPLAAGATKLVRGARTVAGQAMAYAELAPFSRPALVNGAVGMVSARHGRVTAVGSVTVTRGRITEINILADPARLRRLDFTALGD